MFLISKPSSVTNVYLQVTYKYTNTTNMDDSYTHTCIDIDHNKYNKL